MDDRALPAHHANKSRSLFRNPTLTPRSTPPLHLRPPVSRRSSRTPSRTRSTPPEPISRSSSGVPSASASSDHLPSTPPPSATAEWVWNWSVPYIPLAWAREHAHHPIRPVKVVRPDFFSHPDCLRATWLGHASFLVSLPTPPVPTRILCDPIFSTRAGPTQYTGVKRRLPPPCAVEDLPDLDFIVISHNHYDHLDLPTHHRIRAQPRNRAIRYLVPLGVKSFFTSSPLSVPASQVFELDWHDEIVLPADPPSTSPRNPGEDGEPTRGRHVRFVCTPAQHNSGRTLVDSRTTLWASWVFEALCPGTDTARTQPPPSRNSLPPPSTHNLLRPDLSSLSASATVAEADERGRLRAREHAESAPALLDADTPSIYERGGSRWLRTQSESPAASSGALSGRSSPASIKIEVGVDGHHADGRFMDGEDEEEAAAMLFASPVSSEPPSPLPTFALPSYSADPTPTLASMPTPRVPHATHVPMQRVSVYFAGDTGLMTPTGPCRIFDDIGARYGPFDLALLPVWRGGSLSFVARLGLRIEHEHPSTAALTSLHATPAHAVHMHTALRARRSLAMHFATFAGSEAEAKDPLLELVQARAQGGIQGWDAEEGGFGWVDVGGTAVVPLDGGRAREVTGEGGGEE